MAILTRLLRGRRDEWPNLPEAAFGYITDDGHVLVGTAGGNAELARRDHAHAPGQVGAATAAQGAKADTALQPDGNATELTATFAQAASRVQLTSGEKISASFGKVMKWFADLAGVAFTGSYNDLANRPASMTPTAHNHAAGDVNSGRLSPARLPTSGAANRVLLVGGANSDPTYGQVALNSMASGTLNVENGGTGAADRRGAKTNLGITVTTTPPAPNAGQDGDIWIVLRS